MASEEISYTTSSVDSYEASFITYDPDADFAGYGSLNYGASRYGDAETYFVPRELVRIYRETVDGVVQTVNGVIQTVIKEE